MAKMIVNRIPDQFQTFNEDVDLSMESICRDLLKNNQEIIQIKKPEIAIKNLLIIIKAAIKLSNKKGFANMSMRDLSRESGLSMGCLYSYFPNKSDIINVLQKQGRIIIAKIMHDRVDHILNLRDRLYMAIRTHLYLSEALKEWFVFFFMEAKNLTRKNRQIPVQLEMETEEIYINILKELKQKRKCNVDDILMVSAMIKALMQDWYLKPWKYSKRNVTVEQYAEFVIKVTELVCEFNQEDF